MWLLSQALFDIQNLLPHKTPAHTVAGVARKSIYFRLFRPGNSRYLNFVYRISQEKEGGRLQRQQTSYITALPLFYPSFSPLFFISGI
jgi:hypothetical protein